jgi:opacity protein-like surface antigen
MSKNLKTLFGALAILFASNSMAQADGMAIGVSAAFVDMQSDGSEQLRNGGTKTTKSISETATIPEIFIEYVWDNGGAFGVLAVPSRDLGKKSRTDTANQSGDDAGTYTADAELKNFVMLYADVPLYSHSGATLYLTGGVAQTTIQTKEDLNSGSSYDDAEVVGLNYGVGIKGGLFGTDNGFYKLAWSLTDFEDIKLSSTAGNQIEANVDAEVWSLGIGYKF